MANEESKPTATVTSHEQPLESSADAISPSSPHPPPRRRSSSSTTGSRIRSASLKFIESNPPRGMWSATGEAAARAPSLTDIRNGSYENKRRSQSNVSLSSKEQVSEPTTSFHSPTVATSSTAPASPKQKRSSKPTLDGLEEDDGFPDIIFGRGEMSDQSFVRGPKKAAQPKEPLDSPVDGDLDTDDLDGLDPRPKRTSKNLQAMFGEDPPHLGSSNQNTQQNGSKVPAGTQSELFKKPIPNDDGVYPNGYSFPPKKSWGEATLVGTKAFLKFTFTPLGFLIVLYGLNVVAWGGMLFLLLCNASPAMCQTGYGTTDCDDKATSPRQIWLEIDSQILNALFCVTGFGLIPWRFRDFYYLMRFRVKKEQAALRRLAGYHRGWFRLPGSDQLPAKPIEVEMSKTSSNPAVPLPAKKVPHPPLTGAWAPPTALWKMDFVVWAFVLNTVVQAALSGCMWGLNRFNRPSWVTGFLVALACIIAGMGGIMQFVEGKRIKKVEGIPLDTAEDLQDVEKEGKKNNNNRAGKEKSEEGSG